MGPTALGSKSEGPKSEFRNKTETRSPKARVDPSTGVDHRWPFGLRPSDLFRISGVGFRAFCWAQQGFPCGL